MGVFFFFFFFFPIIICVHLNSVGKSIIRSIVEVIASSLAVFQVDNRNSSAAKRARTDGIHFISIDITWRFLMSRDFLCLFLYKQCFLCVFVVCYVYLVFLQVEKLVDHLLLH